MYATRIETFGENFRDRLKGDVLEAALAYAAYNEETLSLEILCDHLVEYNCPITAEEYRELQSLISDMGIDIKGPPYRYLKENIIPRQAY